MMVDWGKGIRVLTDMDYTIQDWSCFMKNEGSYFYMGFEREYGLEDQVYRVMMYNVQEPFSFRGSKWKG